MWSWSATSIDGCRHDANKGPPQHRQTGIVDLHAADFVGEDESLPFGEDFEGFGKDVEKTFDPGEFPLDLRDSEAESVLVGGARGHIPELGDVLSRAKNICVLIQKVINGETDFGKLSLPSGGKPQQDIGIDEPRVWHGGHFGLIVIAVDGLARKGGIWEDWNFVGELR